VVQRAQALRELFGARLTLLHIVSAVPSSLEYMPMSYSHDALLPEDFDLENEIVAFARRQIDELGERLGVPPAERLIKLGTTGYTIDQTAEDLGVDLIVIGNHARHGLRALLVPSTSKAVLRTQACDVLCVHLPEADRAD